MYDKPEPWTSAANTDYCENEDGLEVKDYKAVCYKDLRLWVLEILQLESETSWQWTLRYSILKVPIRNPNCMLSFRRIFHADPL